MQRRKFSREFKLEAVNLVREQGVAVVQAAREHCQGRGHRGAELETQAGGAHTRPLPQ
jgi:Transposase